MFPEMRDGPPKVRAAADAAAAQRAVARLEEMSVDLRACAVLDPDGELLGASTPGEWAAGAAALWRAAERRGRPRPTQIHVGTEAGEVFAVRTPGGGAVAVTERFTLASLMFCDLRAVLRDLEPGSAGEEEEEGG